MKIIHISTTDSGGAGLAALRLHKGLLSQGHDSRMLVLNKTSTEPEVYSFKQNRGKPFPLSTAWSYVELTARKLGIPLSRAEKYRQRLCALQKNSFVFLTLPFSDLDIASHSLVREADIVHLHWVADFLDYPTFFKEIKKPIIWTVHDENLYMGGFHYARMRNKNPLFDAFDDELAEIKRQGVAQCDDLTIVSLSRMMMERSLSSEITANRAHRVIHNPVDYGIFRPLDRICAREVLGLPRGKKILCFVSYEIRDSRKGLVELLVALKKLGRSDLALCAVGAGDIQRESDIEIFHLGLVVDQRMMPIVYSASDLFVMPSYQEAFAQAPLEAMACGVPVVAFPCSGTEELISEKNGVRTSDFTVDALAAGIEKALSTSYDRAWIRSDVIERFGIEKIVSQYVELYREVLQRIAGAK